MQQTVMQEEEGGKAERSLSDASGFYRKNQSTSGQDCALVWHRSHEDRDFHNGGLSKLLLPRSLRTSKLEIDNGQTLFLPGDRLAYGDIASCAAKKKIKWKECDGTACKIGRCLGQRR